VSAEAGMGPPRYFTPEEANELLGVVRPLAERMVEVRRAQLRAQRRQAQVVLRVASNGGGLSRADVEAAASEAERAVESLRAAVEEIQNLGVVVKDLDRGLVDFPAVSRGREIYLCWELGEDEVGYWHGIEDGYAGRQPLPLP
jgi:hypothetical protein